MARRWIVVAAGLALAASACASGTAPQTGSQAGPLQRSEEGLLEARLPGSLDVPLGTGGVAQVNDPLPGPGASGDSFGGTGTAAFYNYPAPRIAFNQANNAGETSIGVNPATNTAMFLMSLNTARVTWDDSAAPAVATWENVSVGLTHRITLDPILYSDPATGRTFVNQLNGAHSVLAFTDDDGDTWTHTQPPSVAPSFDHQSIGAGPYPDGVLGPIGDYPNAVYYCAQGVVVAQCARSDDGGMTWGAPAVTHTLITCSGLHGDPRVGPDGTVYVPHKNCVNGQGVVYSRDAGITWSMSPLPGTTTSKSDAQIGFDAGGRMYVGTASGGKPVVLTSTDQGQTFSAPAIVDGDFGLRNITFPEVVAGDDGRAAVSFYGTTTGGNYEAEDFDGVWHIYTAFTYDGGRTWDTVQVTPDNDPVQRGCIWMSGGTNPCRNLLDFQGTTMDADGRVLVGYADGCTLVCTFDGAGPSSSRASYGTIARQTAGMGLLAGS